MDDNPYRAHTSGMEARPARAVSPIRRGLLALAAVLGIAVLEAAVFDWEAIGATLLVSLWVAPSIGIYLVVERFIDRWPAAKHLAFTLSVLPLMVIFVAGWLRGGEGADIGRVFSLWYGGQLLAAYAGLQLPQWRRLTI